MNRRTRLILGGTLVVMALSWSGLAAIELRGEVEAIENTYTHKPFFSDLYGSPDAVVHGVRSRVTGLQSSLRPRFDYEVTIDLTVGGRRVQRRASARFKPNGEMQYTSGGGS